ncbi:MAG: hypothetical protein LBK98_09515 [Peptococcaceae bacterium]|jgi:hypothetical protein|nr:hypothetical protein [Peptococcaceae bacterium]
MLTKLWLYEMRACGRILLPLYGALILLSLLLGFLGRFSNDAFGVILPILLIIFFGLLVAIFFVTLILLIQRFWRNLLKSEGYLMFTLPVSAYQLVGAKLLSACCWFILGGIAVSVAMLALFLQQDFDMVRLFFRDFYDGALVFIAPWRANGATVYQLLQFLLIGLSNMAQQILTLYAALSISQIPNRFRVPVAYGSFLALNYVQNFAATGLSRAIFAMDDVGKAFAALVSSPLRPFFLSLLAPYPSSFYNTLPTLTPADITLIATYLNFILAVGLITNLLYFLLSGALLKNKLNLL